MLDPFRSSTGFNAQFQWFPAIGANPVSPAWLMLWCRRWCAWCRSRQAESECDACAFTGLSCSTGKMRSWMQRTVRGLTRRWRSPVDRVTGLSRLILFRLAGGTVRQVARDRSDGRNPQTILAVDATQRSGLAFCRGGRVFHEG